MASVAPRRFDVEPIETTSRSSKDLNNNYHTEPPKTPRRFVPEVVETTSTQRRKLPDPIETSQKAPRRFSPEPFEVTTGTSRKGVQQTTAETKCDAKEKKARRSRNKFAEEWENQTTKKSPDCATRKFSPELIETAQRSRRSGDTTPALLASDKTEATPATGSKNLKKLRIDATPPPPENTPTADFSHNPLFAEIERATSPLTGRRPSRMRSQHSFRVPDLDPIESSESEPSNPASPITSPSITSDRSFMYKEATRMRESVDARTSGYLLELAAKAAEKQLEEQAMAAFPNHDHHEPVHHFVDHESDDASSFSEESPQSGNPAFTQVNWELAAMRRHQESREKRREMEPERNHKCGFKTSSPEAETRNPWASPIATRDPELECMRKDARPPMLGKDIRFPRCPSPEPARFDTTQGCDAVRISMCYLAEQSQAAERGEGLWCGGSTRSVASNPPSLYSNTSSRSPSHGNSGGGAGPGGLWGGCCITSGLTPPRGPTGILTPKIDAGSLLSPCPTPQMSLLPPTPPASHADFACIDEKLAAEVAIEEDFGDDFITQVYNYLSLGYPSIARMFDEELSTISKIPVCELRQDDHLSTSRGYIRLGADGNLTDASITEESCMRWRALRVYIREWARQHPGMAADGTVGVGTGVRKGSWAV